MNAIKVSPGINHFADVAAILRQAKSLTVKCMGQEFTDLVVTEEGGAMVVHAGEEPKQLVQVAELPAEQPKRRGRPPKAVLEGDSAK